MDDPIYEPSSGEGWVRDDADIPFARHVGSTGYRHGESAVEYGFMPRPEVHGKLYRRLHGGMIAAFADYALGHACWLASGGGTPHVTIHLGINCMAAGDPGEWTTCQVEIQRRTRSLAFIRGEVQAEGTCLATANGVWKAIRPTGGLAG